MSSKLFFLPFATKKKLYQHWSLYSTCTLLVQYMYASKAYIYCTSSVQVLYNDQTNSGLYFCH